MCGLLKVIVAPTSVRPTLPTNNVRKRFVAKNVSGNTQNVKVELKVEVSNDVALRRL